VRLGGDELVVFTAGRRQLDVDDAVVAALDAGVAVDGGVGLAREDDFFDLGHDGFLAG
jgi:hypothetical protein